MPKLDSAPHDRELVLQTATALLIGLNANPELNDSEPEELVDMAIQQAELLIEKAGA